LVRSYLLCAYPENRLYDVLSTARSSQLCCLSLKFRRSGRKNCAWSVVCGWGGNAQHLFGDQDLNCRLGHRVLLMTLFRSWVEKSEAQYYNCLFLVASPPLRHSCEYQPFFRELFTAQPPLCTSTIRSISILTPFELLDGTQVKLDNPCHKNVASSQNCFYLCHHLPNDDQPPLIVTKHYGIEKQPKFFAYWSAQG